MTSYSARRCPACGKAVAIRRDGALGWHTDTNRRTAPHYAAPPCEGWGSKPDSNPGEAPHVTSYPPGIDGPTVMRNTATAFQDTLNRLLMADSTARAIDEDMLELRISGMHARALLRTMADHGIIQYPRISTTTLDATNEAQR